MALGGVATGSMNAQVAAIATGIASSIGSIPMPAATAVATGRNVAAVAVFEVSSVRNRIPAAAITTIRTTGSPPRSARSEEHTSELQSRGHLVCRLLLEKKN